MKALQKFSQQYLNDASKMNPKQIAEFLENFRLMFAQGSRSPQPKLKPICIKMPEDLLLELKRRAHKKGMPYQTFIKYILQNSLIRDQ